MLKYELSSILEYSFQFDNLHYTHQEASPFLIQGSNPRNPLESTPAQVPFHFRRENI